MTSFKSLAGLLLKKLQMMPSDSFPNASRSSDWTLYSHTYRLPIKYITKMILGLGSFAELGCRVVVSSGDTVEMMWKIYRNIQL